MATPKDPNPYDTLAERIEKDPELRQKDLRAILLSIPEVKPLIVGAAIRGLGARKAFWSKEKDDWVFEPDFNAQGKAMAFLAAYGEGLPVQATVNLNVESEKKRADLAIEDAIRSSPALLEAMEKVIRKAKARTPGERAAAQIQGGVAAVVLEE